VGAALGDAQPVRDVTQPDAGVAGDAQRHVGVVWSGTPSSSLSWITGVT
jgi:hypothetical protein